MILTLPQIEGKIREFTALIYAPEEFIPTVGFSNQTGLPHIEIQDGCYAFIVSEKGKELSRETFDNVDELVFKVLQEISSSMACELVFKDTYDQDYSERYLTVQKNIISKIYLNENDTIKPKQATISSEKNSALSESRKKTLVKNNIKKSAVQD